MILLVSTMTSIRDILSPAAIDIAVDAVKIPGSFFPSVFFQAIGVTPRDFDVVKEIFNILDTNANEYIQIDEVGNILGSFQLGARKLTPSETAAFMKAGDPNNTGKITLAGVAVADNIGFSSEASSLTNIVYLNMLSLPCTNQPPTNLLSESRPFSAAALAQVYFVCPLEGRAKSALIGTHAGTNAGQEQSASRKCVDAACMCTVQGDMNCWLSKGLPWNEGLQ
ncbi:unnamed protein product [Ranitomeya imitator]|uniref:Parvalbumin n=1 Tax=Ranitomeya imitator TaxID=111125 RepID=A0ABN9MQR4_9NEOB|nr:unnamed protein product [Ranitomeya imitator]